MPAARPHKTVSASPPSTGSRLESLARIAYGLPYIFVFNAMFFLPDGDSYMRWSLLPMVLIGAAIRLGTRHWRIGNDTTLMPTLLYATVLLLSHLTLGGYESTVKSFAFICLFLYFGAVIGQLPTHYRWLPVIAAAQLLLLAVYQYHFAAMPRVQGFTNPLFLAMFACSVGVANLYLSTTCERRICRWVFIAAAVAALYATALTQSRGILIAIPVLGAIYLIHAAKAASARPRWRFRLGMLIALAVGIALTLQVGERFLLGWQELSEIASGQGDGLDSQETSVGFRLMIWAHAYQAFLQSPVYGLGSEAWQGYKDGVLAGGAVVESMRSLFATTHAHNQYLQELVMRGIFGLAALLAMFLGHIMIAGRLLQRAPWAAYAMFSIVLAFMFFGLTEAALKHPDKIFTYTMSLAFLHALAHHAGSQENADRPGGGGAGCSARTDCR